MPSHMQNSLIFHYNLKFYGKDTDNYEGISLKRFVMQVENLFITMSFISGENFFFVICYFSSACKFTKLGGLLE